MTQTAMKHGDFTGLAHDYSRYRPGYAPSVVAVTFALLERPTSEIDAADVGAGTGIWTRMLAERGPRTIVAVEPNDDMRKEGILASRGTHIEWRRGQGEATDLPAASFDLVTMASSFHWVDFEAGCREFQRILRPGGRFVAVWNPRLIEANPLLVEIEAEITRLKPDIRRVSSGRSGLTDRLTDRLRATPGFDDVIYVEACHSVQQSPTQYLGAWRSVNDLQVQLGPERFERFLQFVTGKVADLPAIETTFLTRAWMARRAWTT
jgi:SAM-dependent methyltransferase